MENFSTPRGATVPWVTNLATLAVVVTAIGWSNGQRPNDPPQLSQAAPATAALPKPADAAVAMVPARWPGQAIVAPAEGLQAVGYATTQRR